MAVLISINKIQSLGFEWPKIKVIQEYCVLEDDQVNLEKTLDALRKSQAFYRSQTIAAFNFKSQTGADYADFTTKFDDYARKESVLREAINHVEHILAVYLKEISPQDKTYEDHNL